MYVCLSVMPHYATCVLIVLCTVRPHWRSHCASSLCVLIVHPHCEPLLSVLILRPAHSQKFRNFCVAPISSLIGFVFDIKEP